MFRLIVELFSLLTSAQKKRFYALQVLVTIMAFAEILGVASIAPFMALVGDMGVLERENIIATLFQQSGLTSPREFIFWLGVLVLFILGLAAIISIYTTWRLAMFANKVGAEIADSLYSYYLHQDWLFHSTGSSSQLTKQIATESTRVTTLVLQPLLQMNAKITLATFLSIAIFAYNPLLAIVGLTVFTLAYLLLFKVVRKQLHNNGQIISAVLAKRFRLMNEGFGGIKDVLLLGRNQDFIEQFKESGEKLAYSQGTNLALVYVPRYFMELIAFGAMIALVLYLIKAHDGNLGVVLPILSVYALASFKLLPAFQQIYSSLAQIKGNLSAFESIQQDLSGAQSQKAKTRQSGSGYLESLPFTTAIELKDVSFTYPGKNEQVIKSLNITIPANKIIGIVGPSGSGKSTVIDMLLGLIQPQFGQFLIDNEPVNELNRRAWQNNIGFVPQSIFLTEGSIAENVAFGISEKDIDLQQVNKVLNLAHLDQLVEVLPEGIHTKVGERGVQLSGGQRQRIGIARALYQEASVIVFDEATSALDGITEKLIMDAIHDFSGHKTIVMIAHRLKTVQKCDIIYMIDEGQVVDQGSYDELLKTNQQFKKMVDHA